METGRYAVGGRHHLSFFSQLTGLDGTSPSYQKETIGQATL